MSGRPTLTEIEAQWRTSGSGVCVIVEGETALDDAYYYEKWFGDRALEISFFPQDGWEQVAAAVAHLRTTLGPRKVYGILDRDFEPTTTLDPFPADGLVRTEKYTLENYLLDAECWHQYLHPHFGRAPRPGWQSVHEIRGQIERLYRLCVPLSAYNWTLRLARLRDDATFRLLPETERRYRTHPGAITALGDVPTHLHDAIQAPMNLCADLGLVYVERLAVLNVMPIEGLEQLVSGKYVLAQLRECFPVRGNTLSWWDDVLSAYMYECAHHPPSDIARIVSSILRDANP